MINQPMPGLTPETADKRYLKTTGGTMSGDIAMGGKKVTGMGTPTADGDAANKKYVDDAAGNGITLTEADARYLKLNGGTMTGNINMLNHCISNLTTPNAELAAVNLKRLCVQALSTFDVYVYIGASYIHISGGSPIALYAQQTSSNFQGYSLPIVLNNPSGANGSIQINTNTNYSGYIFYVSSTTSDIRTFEIRDAPATFQIPGRTTYYIFAGATH